MKKCEHCHIEKPLSDFYVTTKGKHYTDCKRCTSDYNNEVQKGEEYKEKRREYNRRYYRKKKQVIQYAN